MFFRDVGMMTIKEKYHGFRLSGTILFIFVLPISLHASDTLTVYVSDFLTRDRHKDTLTKNLTEEFEELLTHDEECCKVLERRNYDRLIAETDKERMISEIHEFSSLTLDSLYSYGANHVFFGEVYYDLGNGEIKITITLQNFNGSKRMQSERFAMKDQNDPNIRIAVLSRIIDYFCPPIPDPDPEECEENRTLLLIPAIGYTAGSIIGGISARHYSNETSNSRGVIPAAISEERVIAIGIYKRNQAKEQALYVTSANLVICSLPFWMDYLDKGPKINKWIFFSTYTTGSIAFFIGGITASDNSRDAQDKVNNVYTFPSVDREHYWGKFNRLDVWKEIYYVNAAIDLLTAFLILVKYDRSDEHSRELSVSLNKSKSLKLCLDYGHDNPSRLYNVQAVLKLYLD